MEIDFLIAAVEGGAAVSKRHDFHAQNITVEMARFLNAFNYENKVVDCVDFHDLRSLTNNVPLRNIVRWFYTPNFASSACKAFCNSDCRMLFVTSPRVRSRTERTVSVRRRRPPVMLSLKSNVMRML